MQISLRVSPETSARLKALAEKTGKTQTALILEALDEKYKLKQDRTKLIRDLAGWMPKAECDGLRHAVSVFDQVNDKDWP